MRAASLAILLAPGALAGGSCRAPKKGGAGSVGGNYGRHPGANTVAAPVTRTWSRIEPTQVLDELHSLAHATPSAVQLLPGVSIPGLGELVSDIMKPVTGFLESVIEPPPGCSTLGGGAPTSSAYGSGGAPSSTAYGSGAPSSTAYGSGAPSSTAYGSGAPSSTPYGSGSGSSTTPTSTPSTPTSTPSTPTSTPSTPTSTPTSSKTSPSGCASPTARVEWRKFSAAQQQALMKATQCLMTTPPRSGLAGVQSRWDDLVAVHQQMAPTVHGVGQFLPWHRQFMWIYEQELRNTCQYAGPIPWWDETQDAGDFSGAPMMTNQLYGSAPRGQAVCINTGTFKGIVLNIGPGSSNTLHCLSRGVDESLSSAVTNSFVSSCNSYANFGQMTHCQFMGPHAYTHDAIGGSMSDVASSPNDPLFYLHHAFVDRNYRNWQLVNPSQRTYAIGSYTTAQCETSNGGAGCVPTTLNYVLSSKGFYPDVTVAQVADTQGGHLCYYYDS